MAAEFGHPSTPAISSAIRRPRLTTALAARFDHRVTVVTGPAGAGKTTLLSQAVEANALDPLGEDVWLAAETLPDDPFHLLAGLGAALGIGIAGDDAAEEQVHTELWRRAPNDVAIIIDDAHNFQQQTSIELLAALARTAPANTHLVLAGRTEPLVPLARLDAAGQVLRFGPDDLALDEEEAKRLLQTRNADLQLFGELPRHAALADLALTAGSARQTAYLWEEVLGNYSNSQLQSMAKLAVVGASDPSLARAITGLDDPLHLFSGLPLVAWTDDGSVRLHSLLRECLMDRVSAQEQAEVQLAAARHCQSRGELRRAVQFLSDHGNRDEAIALCRQFVKPAAMARSYEDLTYIRQYLRTTAPELALTALVAGELQVGSGLYSGDFLETASGLEKVAGLARSEGDAETEAAALFRAVEAYELAAVDLPEALIDRFDALAEEVAWVPALSRHLHCRAATWQGEPDKALAHLNRPPNADTTQELVLRAFRLCDLGLPEEVEAERGPGDLLELPKVASLIVGFAVWMRGGVSPELAGQHAGSIIDDVVPKRILMSTIWALTSSTLVHLMCADLDAARSTLARAEAARSPSTAARIGIMVDVAAAAVAASEGDDDRARKALEDAERRLPLRRWPSRGHMFNLPLVYLLVPETRETLDNCRVGPSLRTAISAGQALVALLESEDPTPAVGLPWTNTNLLRAHVLPVHLYGLALVAAQAGSIDARAMLDAIPGEIRWLDYWAASPINVVQVAAEARRDRSPPQPSGTIEVRTLGRFEVLRNGRSVTGPEWRRQRVRELLGLLLERREMTRAEVFEQLWPDMDGQRGATNLRVNLAHLQRVLEPERADLTPLALRTEGETLVLHPAVQVDADRLEKELAAARRVDTAGDPAAAMELYADALALYDGPYLAGHEHDWFELRRARLEAEVMAAMSRLGELEAARGEPELALAWGRRALVINPIHERAMRLVASCLAAMDNRPAAVDHLRGGLARLAQYGLEPESATLKVRDRIERG